MHKNYSSFVSFARSSAVVIILKFYERVTLKTSKSYESTISTINLSSVNVVLGAGMCKFVTFS